MLPRGGKGRLDWYLERPWCFPPSRSMLTHLPVVNRYVVDTAQKLRFVPRLILRGTKRFLGNVAGASPAYKTPNVKYLEERPPKVSRDVLDHVKTDILPVPRGGLTRNESRNPEHLLPGNVLFGLKTSCTVQGNIRSPRCTDCDHRLP
ncbi:hypothetical protein M413DRAFT_152123 [Hebeloma cylindrosporum]|uniref:Uncharacterized protein n=1 Tax=Hebeloma cylindrosporum TaxID=76867 RepID=A0A0C3CDF7_HEBCY|nr:hypothetical protein M413DRAFT_152123 [Hebeloma cylindrosporum h7]